jgi:hypothetical protein
MAGVNLARLLIQGFEREPAPPSGDNAELAVFGSHDERLQDALDADRRQNVRHVRRRIAIAHVAFGDFEL